MKRLAAYLSTAILAASIAVPESAATPFRTNLAAVVTLSVSKPEGEQLSIGAADAIAIQFAEDSLFVQGIEIEIKIPRVPPQTIAWTLYRGVKPAPRADRVAYDGEELLGQALPDRVSFVLQIPASPRHALKSGPYATVVPTVLEAGDYPLVFKLWPIAKGVAPDLELSGFKIRVRPLIVDEGVLKLDVDAPDAQSASGAIEVFIDDRKHERWREPVFLKKGSHTVQVKAEGFRDEVRTVVLEPGKVVELSIALQDTKPVAVFEAPANAVITLDGVPVDVAREPKLALEAGEHTVVCRIGDYAITRKFTAYRGKTYRIVLSVDLAVQESQ